MSWCGKCFMPQSETDIETDGEYEYFADSNFICKRVKTPVPTIAPEQHVTTVHEQKLDDEISSCQTSDLPSAPSLPSGLESCKESSKLKNNRVRQVCAAAICDHCPKFASTYKKSNQVDALNLKNQSPKDVQKPEKTSKSSESRVTSTMTSESSKARTTSLRQGKPLLLMRRLFGRSDKVVHDDTQNERQNGNFKELKEFSRPSVTTTTTTLFWTVRVTKK